MTNLNVQLDKKQLTELAKKVSEQIQKGDSFKEFLTRFEGAEHIGAHVNTLDLLIKKGVIKKYILGHKVFVKRAQLNDAIERGLIN